MKVSSDIRRIYQTRLFHKEILDILIMDMLRIHICRYVLLFRCTQLGVQVTLKELHGRTTMSYIVVGTHNVL